MFIKIRKTRSLLLFVLLGSESPVSEIDHEREFKYPRRLNFFPVDKKLRDGIILHYSMMILGVLSRKNDVVNWWEASFYQHLYLEVHRRPQNNNIMLFIPNQQTY